MKQVIILIQTAQTIKVSDEEYEALRLEDGRIYEKYIAWQQAGDKIARLHADGKWADGLDGGLVGIYDMNGSPLAEA